MQKTKKLIIKVVVLLLIAVLSFCFVAKAASSPELHKDSLASLEDKKVTAMKITAATVGVSTALAAVPGDATTPLANKILDVGSYLIVATGAIILEKMLLTLTGHIAFAYLIPAACLLYILFLFKNQEWLRIFALKLALFAVAIFLVVPASVQVSDIIYETHQASIEQIIEDTDAEEEVAQQPAVDEEEEKGFWSGLLSAVKDGVNSVKVSVTEALDSGERMLSRFIDAVAVMIITVCVIPIGVLFFFLWLLKMIFNLDFKVRPPKLPHYKNKGGSESKMLTGGEN